MRNDRDEIGRIFGKFLPEYWAKHENQTRYGEGLDLFLQLLGEGNADILDLACGPGNVSQYVFAKRPDLRITGIDVSEEMIDFAQLRLPQASFHQMDVMSIDSLKRKFDGIICSFCLPYLTTKETCELLKKCSNNMNVGGVIYISTMIGNENESGLRNSSNGEEQLYMSIYEKEKLLLMISTSGFSEAYSHVVTNGEEEELIYIGRKDTEC